MKLFFKTLGTRLGARDMPNKRLEYALILYVTQVEDSKMTLTAIYDV